jgi:hypothetical protein
VINLVEMAKQALADGLPEEVVAIFYGREAIEAARAEQEVLDTGRDCV